MRVRPDRPRWPDLRRFERALMLGYLALVALFLACFALPPLRRLGFRVVEKGIRVWDARWAQRVELGEAMVRAGRYQEAADYLARLDRDFPARDVRHARDKERERLLVALGRSYAELDRKQRAIETYQQLVAFDPRNYRNYYALAVTSNRLLAGWAPAPEARDAFLQVLRINPSHLPSVRGAIAFYSARGEFAEVVQLYRDYLDAYLRQGVTISLSTGVSDVIQVPVDGEFHEYDVPLAQPAGWSGELSIATGGFTLGLDSAALVPPSRVGVAERRQDVSLRIADAKPQAMTAMDGGAWRAESGEGRLGVPIPAQPLGIGRVRLRLRLFKPVDPTTWQMVAPAYRNRLDAAGLAAARARTILLPSILAADSVLQRPFWATVGGGIGADDTRY